MCKVFTVLQYVRIKIVLCKTFPGTIPSGGRHVLVQKCVTTAETPKTHETKETVSTNAEFIAGFAGDHDARIAR